MSLLTLGHDSRPRSSGRCMLLLFSVCVCVCVRKREGEGFFFLMANDKLLKWSPKSICSQLLIHFKYINGVCPEFAAVASSRITPNIL